MEIDPREIKRLEIETARLDLERYEAKLNHYSSQAYAGKPPFDATIRFAEIAIKALLALNGASALALLTFMGHLDPAHPALPVFRAALFYFGLGAVVSVIVALLAYLAQVTLTESTVERTGSWVGNTFRTVALIAALFGIFAFFLGLNTASDALAGNKHTFSITEAFKAFEPLVWAVVVAGLLLAAMFSFRKQLSARAKDIGNFIPAVFHRARVATPRENQNSAEDPSQKQPSQFDPTAAFWLEVVDRDLAQLGACNDTDLITRLKQALASTLRVAHFERAARLIYGTQIAALRRLSCSEGLAKDGLEGIYGEHVVRRGRVEPSDFPNWIDFLLSSNLIYVEQDTYNITDIGRQFLAFADQIYVNEHKHL